MRSTPSLAILTLASTAFASLVPIIQRETSKVAPTFEVEASFSHTTRSGSLEKRAGYPGPCPDFFADGAWWTVFTSFCDASGPNSLGAFTCRMMAANMPNNPIITLQSVNRECQPGYVCLDQTDGDAVRHVYQAWCHRKHFSQPVDLPNPGDFIVNTRYDAARRFFDRASATVLLADPTGTNGTNISEIDIQPMSHTQIGLYPNGPKTICTNADTCSLTNIPPGTVQFQTTLTAGTAIAVAMMFAVTG